MNLPSSVHFFERGWLSANNILLTDDKQAILIDTGYHTHAEQTLGLVRQQLAERPLTHIVNTHLHSDHCGGNSRLQAFYPQAITLIPPGLAKHVRDWDAHALSYTPTGQSCPPFKLSDTLKGGMSFEVASRAWNVHAAPGHDPHSVVLHCPDEGLLISADALWENGFGVVFPEIEGEDAFQEVADTLDMIESLQPKHILPGHGAAFDDVGGALTRARSKLSMYLNAPDKNAIYAAKVLLKFKLLELQQVDMETFLTWAQGTEYLETLYRRYGASLGFDVWLYELCHAMQRSGACRMEAGIISNV